MERITLKTLPQATAQQVFEYVANHLLTQGKRSQIASRAQGYTQYLACAYRGEDNTSCAAGCLIADKEYQHRFEGIRWSGLAKKGLVPDNHCELITELQHIHDGYHPADWRLQLITFAKDNHLDDSILKA